MVGGAGHWNRVIGNEIGIDWLGSADANAVGVYLSGSSNYVGGTAPGEGNVLSGSTYHGVYAYGSTNNTIQGNLIGTNPAGTGAMPNGLTGIWLSNATGNTIGGGVAGARNVISGNNGPGVWISEPNQVVGPTTIGIGTTNVPITIPSGGAITDLNVNGILRIPRRATFPSAC
jgi:parallel beta-helix repeat protein